MNLLDILGTLSNFAPQQQDPFLDYDIVSNGADSSVINPMLRAQSEGRVAREQQRQLQRAREQELEERKAERAREVERQRRFKEAIGNMSIGDGPYSDLYSLAESPQELAALGQLSRSLGPDVRQIGNQIVQVGSDGQVTPLYSAPVTSAEAPSSVREYKYFSSLSPDEQRQYLQMKRSAQIMNLGGTQAVYDPLTSGVMSEFAVTPKPEQMPEFREEQAEAEVLGRERGVAAAKLESMQANMPNVRGFVRDLKDLAEVATYTKGGQLVDVLRRETGQEPRESAIAREKFIAKVNNEVLPLLRQTFGAAFTVQEGESLRATLGDVNKSPLERLAALDAFIEAKVGEIESLQRRVSPQESQTSTQRLRYNPETGTLE